MSIAEQSLRTFLEALAARTPTPGGGAVAGVSGATSAALLLMVVRFSKGRPELAAHESTLAEAETALERVRTRLLELADEDAHAYAQYSAAAKRPKDDPDRAAALRTAKEACLGVPTAMGRELESLARLCTGLTGKVNTHLESDREVASHLALASARSARAMILVNLQGKPGPHAEHLGPVDEAIRVLASG